MRREREREGKLCKGYGALLLVLALHKKETLQTTAFHENTFRRKLMDLVFFMTKLILPFLCEFFF